MWPVQLNKAALRDFRRLDRSGKESAADMMDHLAEDGPAIPGAIEMRANPGMWRVRFNNEKYRMVYRVSHRKHSIVVTRLRPRNIAYRGMKH